MYYTKNIKTTIMTGDLIEIYRMLNLARLTGDFTHLSDAMDCIASQIDSNTDTPARYDIKPSVSSLILPSNQPGIVLSSGSRDIMCANQQPVSMAMSGGVCQCDSACPLLGNNCYPADGHIQLACGRQTGDSPTSGLDTEAALQAAEDSDDGVTMDTPIEHTGLKTGVVNALLRYLALTHEVKRPFVYRDVLDIPVEELPNIRGIGAKYADSLRVFIESHPET